MEAVAGRELFPFVGRRSELAELEACLADAVGGHGRLILVTGEPGIGKTRLVDELSGRAAGAGVAAAWGFCWEAGGAPAFWPWIQILRDLTRGEDVASLAAGVGSHLRILVPELSAGRDDGGTPPNLDSEHARFRLFDEMAAFLQNAAAIKPRLLVLEDLHAADLPSLLLLQFLSRALRDARILIAGTARDAETRRRAEVARALDDSGGRRLLLGGLDENEIAELVQRFCGTAAPREIVTSIHRATDGNPFFADETVRLLLSENHGQLPSGTSLTIPGRVRDAIRRRLEPITPDCRRALSVAAVVGKEFDLELVSRICGLGAEERRDWLAEVESLGLVRASRVGLSFAHSLIRETVCEDLSGEERAELHSRVAEALEASHAGDVQAPLAEVAFHLHAAFPRADAGKAADFAIAAGKRAFELCAYEDAVEQYALALASLERESPRCDRRRCEVLLATGEASRRAGDVGGARQAFLEAAERARTLGEPERFAEGALGFGGPWVAMGVVDEPLVGLLEEALERLAETSAAVRARLLSRLAMELYFEEDTLARRTSLCDEAVRIGEALGDHHVRAEVLSARHFALWGPDNVGERLEIATAIAEIARELRSDELSLAGHHWRIVDLIELGEIEAADREIEAMTKVAQRLRIPVYLWQVTLHRATRALLAGRFEEAEELASRALDHGRRSQPESAEASFLLQVLALRREQGRLDEMVEPIERLVRSFPGLSVLEVVLASVHATLGNRAVAAALLDRQTAKGFAGIPRAYWWLGMLASAAEAVVALGDRVRAQEIYDILLPYEGRNLVQGRSSVCFGSAARYLGALAATLGRLDDAERHFEAALRHNVRMGARPFEAWTRLEYARVSLANGKEEKATWLLSGAREIARVLGMEAIRPRVDELLQSPPRGDPASDDRSFLREGQFWTIRFEGRSLRFKDSRGLRLIAWLLRHPRREFHAIELASVSSTDGEAAAGIGPREMLEEGLAATRLGDAGDLLDARARREYGQRVADLEDELEEARRFRDSGRIERIEGELDALRQALSAALGLGRRPRSRSPAERARVALTKVIRSALRRITDEDPGLGRHFDRAIRTGMYFSYNPGERDVSWTV